MATAIPPWLIGRNATGLTVQRLSTSVAGVFTNVGSVFEFVAASPFSGSALWGIIDGVETNLQAALTENITPVTSPWENTVVLEEDDSFSIFEILRTIGPSTSDPNFLSQIWNTAQNRSAPYAHMLFTLGNQTWDFYGLIGSYTKEVRKGKNIARMQLRQTDPIDNVGPLFVEVANPLYSDL